MALKKPVVITDGEFEQLQAGDNLADADLLMRAFTTTALIGQVVYADSAGNVDLAQANAAGTSIVVGLATEAVTAPASGAVQTDNVLALTTGQWDAVTGETGGLTVNKKYYLDDATAGMMLQDDNLSSLGVGDYIVQIGKALSTTEFLIDIEKRILL